jgi:hypothetical protein
MYLNTTVKIPQMKGRIINKKKGGTTYILYPYIPTLLDKHSIYGRTTAA